MDDPQLRSRIVEILKASGIFRIAQAHAGPHRASERAQVEGARSGQYVFAHQKGPMELAVRTIGLARARVKIGLANLVFNMKRMGWLTRKLSGSEEYGQPLVVQRQDQPDSVGRAGNEMVTVNPGSL